MLNNTTTTKSHAYKGHVFRDMTGRYLVLKTENVGTFRPNWGYTSFLPHATVFTSAHAQNRDIREVLNKHIMQAVRVDISLELGEVIKS